jgi:hypothetical protein
MMAASTRSLRHIVLSLALALILCQACPAVVRMEAEDAETTGPSLRTEWAGYSGTGYLLMDGSVGSGIIWTVDCPFEGDYMVTVCYYIPTVGFTDKTNDLYVNGTRVASTVYTMNDAWTPRLVGPATFLKGWNTVELRHSWGWMGVDYIELPWTMVVPFADQPVPSNRAPDVPRDIVMGWQPGAYAKTHDVYLGTNLNDVNTAGRTNPLNVLVAQGQDANTYDPPGLLEFGRTYYWRIDEVNAADSFIYKGVVWSFTVEPVAYAVPNVTATASSAVAGSEPENTVNGSGLDANDLHATTTSAMWLAKTNLPLWIQYEFNRTYTLHQMWVWNYNAPLENLLGFGLKGVTIEYSTDATDWMTLGDFEFARASSAEGYAHNTTVDFGGVPARYVRINVNSAWSTRGQYGLSEVRFFYLPVQAQFPSPASGAAGVSADTALSWRPGREAALHEVYLSSDPNTLPGASPVATVSQSTYAPIGLTLGATYYWRVDEVNTAAAVGTWPGEVWNFSTAEYLVVDDMERYTDDAPDRIFDTWVDGYNMSANGCQVGYNQAPFAERTTRHGGGQSMPFSYNNAGSATSSEATRTFGSAQDWTRAGVKVLTLYFYGATANAPAPLYVKINSTKIIYGGSQQDLTKAAWTLWNVDLTGVPASTLRGVSTLTIGVGTAGSSGSLLIDDIRLYRTAPVAN